MFHKTKNANIKNRDWKFQQNHLLDDGKETILIYKKAASSLKNFKQSNAFLLSDL